MSTSQVKNYVNIATNYRKLLRFSNSLYISLCEDLKYALLLPHKNPISISRCLYFDSHCMWKIRLTKNYWFFYQVSSGSQGPELITTTTSWDAHWSPEGTGWCTKTLSLLFKKSWQLGAHSVIQSLGYKINPSILLCFFSTLHLKSQQRKQLSPRNEYFYVHL